MMIKERIGSFLTYPVFRLGDSAFTRKLHRVHEHLLRVSKVVAIALPTLTGLYLIAGFYLPAQVSFTTADSSCAFAPSLFPGMLRENSDGEFSVASPPRIRIFDTTILSTHLCVLPKAVPSSSTSVVAIRQLGLPFSKQLTINNKASLSASPILKTDGVSTRNNLVFELSTADVYFDYVLSAGDKSVDCHTQIDTVVCPTKELDLEQGAPYTFRLAQTLGESSQALFSKKFTTITSVEITGASVAPESTVYEDLMQIALTASKQLAKVGTVTLSDGENPVEVASAVTDTGLTVSWTTPLQRQKAYTLTIDVLEATDGGHLEETYLLRFTMSGGPLVTSSTLPNVRTAQSPDFTLTFDQPLKPEQDFAQIISITSGGSAVPLSFTVNGTQLRVRATTALQSCADYSVSIKETLTSLYGVSGGNAYSSTHRTQCAREFSIGTSVQGRSIIGYALGSGPKKVVFLGAIHGNEKSTHYLLSSWLDYLEANPSQIPTDRTIIILPKLNPDGFLRNSRFNANNVDLNRNFASANWKTDVIVPGGSVQAGAGGSAPLSEPEARNLAEYLQSVSPSLVMSYHSQGSITIPNGSGNSNSIAFDYAKAVGYQYISAADSAGAFEHETTGALEDWLHESLGVPVVLNELSSHGATGLFQFHRAPMLSAIAK